MKAWLDTTGVSGFGAWQGKRTLIIDNDVEFHERYSRQLRVFVQPVHVLGKGAPSTPTGRLVSDVKSLLLAMLPPDKSNLKVWGASKPVPYTPGAGISQGLALYPMAIVNSTTRGLLSLCDWASGIQTTPDFEISVFPQDSYPSGVEGMNLKLFRSTLFVTENKLKALIHELGHGGPGLYLNMEQYDDPRWAPSGMPLKDMTVFVNDASAEHFSTSLGRFLHLPEGTGQMWTDIMGNIEPSWISLDTLASFTPWLSSLGLESTTAVFGSRDRYYPIPSGEWRIFLDAQVADDVVFPARQRLVPGTFTAFNVSAFANGYIDPAWSESYARWIAYDDAGNIIREGAVYISDNYAENFMDYYALQFTCDVPDNTAVLEVDNPVYTAEGNISGYDVAFSVRISEELSTRIISPVSGATLQEGAVMQWQSTQTRSTVSGNATLGQALQHHVDMSVDGGLKWEPLGSFGEENRLEIPVRNLPAGDNITLRLITSDGLRYAEDSVDNLRILARKPVVDILHPLEGDLSDSSHTWTFVSQPYSQDEILLSDGQWTSSINGILGSGNSLKNIILSPGQHVVTCTVEDSRGLVGQASVNVKVEAEAIESYDFSFAPDALKVTIPGKDTYAQRWAPLALSKEHSIRLFLRNTGTVSNFILKLFITRPGQVETLLTEKTFFPGPFEEAQLTTKFTPNIDGSYQFRAVVEPISPADDAPANNKRIWTYSTSSTGLLTVSGTGRGAISSDPAGISCQGTCSAAFQQGGYVILTATPEPGWMFERWEGDCGGTEKTSALIVDRQSTARAVFRFTPTSILYVSGNATCGDKTPCYATVQEAVNNAETGAVIRIAKGIYTESITLNESKSLTLQGGWNSLYDEQTSNTTFIKAPKALLGSLTLRMVNIKP